MASTPDDMKRALWKAIGGGDKTPGYSPQPQDPSTGVQIPAGGVDDISAIYDPDNPGTPKTTLGDWMSGVVEKNEYKPGGGLSYGTLQVAGADIGDAKVFAADLLEKAREHFDLQSGGGTPDSDGGGAFSTTTLQGLLDKTSGTDGHTLLAGVEGNDWDVAGVGGQSSKSDIAKKTVSEVLKKNRFSPTGDSPYIQDRGYSNGMYTTQNEFGRYDPNANDVTLEDISRIGLGLLLRSTGDGQDPKDGSQTKALVSGLLEQLAIKKVDTVNLQAGTIEGVGGRPNFSQTNQDPTGALINQDGELTKGAGNNSALEARHAKSYGVLNSWLEPFDGPLPTSMILLAAIAMIATLVAGVILGLLLDLIFFIFPPGDEPMGKAPKPMGASLGKPDYGDGNIGFRILQFMGIPTLYSGKGFTKCMIGGVLQFFIGNSFPRILGASAGYYIVVCRAAIRDIEQITRATESTNFKDLIGALEGVFIVLEAFTTSTMFRFLCTMASIGDVAAMSGGVWGKQPLPFAPKDILPETVLPTLANLHEKSRMYTVPEQPNTDFGLAWQMGNLPSQFILTDQQLTMIAENDAGYPDFKMAIGPPNLPPPPPPTAGGDAVAPTQGAVSKLQNVATPGRLSQEWIIAVERALDTQMMPFYFKDLRTNEIIALNAFVEGISDKYSPNWNKEHGFGRTDPVQIYENTERSIGMTFWVAATDERDADEMWYIINRIVAMVYPQWSRGTQRMSGDGSTKFIQPFSQVPTASPLVRMRLGDLFRSNYTRMGLKKQFGYGTKSFDMKVTDTEGTADQAYSAVQEDKIVKFRAAEKAFIERSANGALAPDPYEVTKIAILAQLPLPPPGPETGFAIGEFVTLKPGKYPFMKSTTIDPTKPKTIFGYKTAMSRFKPSSSVECVVLGYFVTPVGPAIAGTDVNADGTERADEGKTKTRKPKLKVRYVVGPAPGTELEATMDTKFAGFKCAHDALTFSHRNFPPMVGDQFSEPLSEADKALIEAGFKDPPDPINYQYAQEVLDFFKPENNAIARSFEAGSGFGIAVAITQLDMDWSAGETIPWDTQYGRRAPMMCKITMGFAPIHDLPLGLDADGGMVAPAYPTGNIIKSMFGIDPWAEGPEAAAVEESRAAWRARGAAEGAAAGAATEGDDPDPASTTE